MSTPPFERPLDPNGERTADASIDAWPHGSAGMLPPRRVAACTRLAQFFPVVVTWPEPPDPDDSAPDTGPDYAPSALRLVPAGQIVTGDLVLGGITTAQGATMPVVYYHLGTYEARPAEFDPSHRCGVCDLYADRDPADMILVHDDPPNWPGVCDPAARDELIAIVPRALR